MSQALVASPPRRERRAPETVVRERLLRCLTQACDTPVALLVAPLGYGKTTLLEQWARHDGRPFAVVTLREPDNEPAHLLESIARALSDVTPIDDDVFIALSTPGGPSTADVLARIERSLDGSTRPFVLVLDDVGALHASDALALLAALADTVPAGSQLALASRSEPALPIGRLRAQHRLVELRAQDLAMTRREATALLGMAGLDLPPDDVVALVRRTEGWPAGLSLAALAVRGEADRSEGHQALRRVQPARRRLPARRADGVARQRAHPVPDADLDPRRPVGPRVRRHARLQWLGRGPTRPRTRERDAGAARPVRHRVPLPRPARGGAARGAAPGHARRRARAPHARERVARGPGRSRSRRRPRRRRGRRGGDRPAAVGEHGSARAVRPRLDGSAVARALRPGGGRRRPRPRAGRRRHPPRHGRP